MTTKKPRFVAGTSGSAALLCACLAAAFVGGCGSDPVEDLAEARAAFTAGDLQAAAFRVRIVLEETPTDSVAHGLLGQIALARGDTALAQRALERAIELGNTAAAVRLALADTHVQTGDSAAALAVLSAAAESDRSPEFWALQAEALLQQGATGEASAALALAGDDTSSTRLLVTRARLEELAQRTDRATLLLDRAVAEAVSAQDRADSLVARARFHLRAQRPGAVADDLRVAARAYEEAGAVTKEFLAQLTLVEVLITLGDLISARTVAAQLAASAPDVPLAAYAEGTVAYRQGRYADAVAKLQLALNGAPANTQVRAALGAAHLGLGNLNLAEQHLQAVLGSVPGDVAAAKLLALTRLRQQRPREALEALLAIPDDRADAEVTLLRSAASLRGGNLDDAVEYARQALAGSPEDQSLQLELARVYLAVGRDTEALRLLDALAPTAKAASTDILRMFAQLRSGDAEAGRASATALVERFPDDPRAHLAAALFAQSVGDEVAAERHLRDAIVVDPGFLAARLTLASALTRSDRLPEAEEALDQALEVAPDDAATLVQLADVTLRRGDAAGAEELLQRAVKVAPNNAAPRVALGEVRIRLNRLEAALSIGEDLGREFPAESGGPFLVGEVRMAQTRYADAASAFATASRRAPAWRLVARQVQALQLAGALADAEARLREWLAEHPRQAEARIVLADHLRVQGRAGEAAREYDEVLAASAVNVIALNNLAWLLRDEDPGRALALAARAVELAPDHPAVLDTWGWLLVASGRAEEGLGDLRRAAALAPGAPEIQYHLGHALATAGKVEESRVLLEELLRSDAAFPSRGEAQELLEAL